MSSADTCLISASTIMTLNVVRPFRKVAQESNLKTTRVTVLVVGFIAWLIASQQKGIISSLLLGYSVFVGGVVIPTLATFVRERFRITSQGALWAVILGGASAILGKLKGGAIMKVLLTSQGQEFFETILGSRYLSILPVVVSLLVILGVSGLTRRKRGGSI
jgi:Na+/proline symporter